MDNYYTIERKLKDAFKAWTEKGKLSSEESYALHLILRDMYLYALEEGSKDPVAEDYFRSCPKNFLK